MRIEVAYAEAPHEVRLATIEMPDGATVADAVRASRLLEGLAAAAIDALQPAIWGRAASPQATLRDGDRVELTRALVVDPKVARRQRYQRERGRNKKAGAP